MGKGGHVGFQSGSRSISRFVGISLVRHEFLDGNQPREMDGYILATFLMPDQQCIASCYCLFL